MTQNKVYTAIGLMSGTSLDGVDCALIETDGEGFVKPLAFVAAPYEKAEREQIRACFGSQDRDDPAVQKVTRLITLRHAQAVETLLRKQHLAPSDIDVIGFHGQTIYHAPKDGVTVQIGDGDYLAKETGIAVVDDFRSADVKAGGEGAPLAPLYHAARIRSAKIELPTVVLNIGGVANVTWIGKGAGEILAFDTGPGNALMDDWVKVRTGAAFDKDGMLAAKGIVRRELMKDWFGHPYFKRTPPKSLDRDEWDSAALAGLSTEDGAATLLAFTVETIIAALNHMPVPPKFWYVCGGGRHNKALMAALDTKLRGAMLGSLKSVDELGWNGDATEAECFGYLAVRSLLGKVLSVPGTTGVPAPQTGGLLHKI